MKKKTEQLDRTETLQKIKNKKRTLEIFHLFFLIFVLSYFALKVIISYLNKQTNN
jgi:hypothetical protein